MPLQDAAMEIVQQKRCDTDIIIKTSRSSTEAVSLSPTDQRQLKRSFNKTGRTTAEAKQLTMDTIDLVTPTKKKIKLEPTTPINLISP